MQTVRRWWRPISSAIRCCSPPAAATTTCTGRTPSSSSTPWSMPASPTNCWCTPTRPMASPGPRRARICSAPWMNSGAGSCNLRALDCLFQQGAGRRIPDAEAVQALAVLAVPQAYALFVADAARPMLVRHLSYFVTLARERHFARAAEACNVAQPTLSAAIRKLEEDLEARLVIRDHRFVGLTPEGERVLAWGRQILTDYNSLREDLSQLSKGLVGTLRLGVIPAAMPSVSFLTTRFCSDHPAADVEIHSLTSRAIQRSLDAFELDGGITYLENEPLENVRRIPLYHEHYVFVTQRSHPFATRKSVTWNE